MLCVGTCSAQLSALWLPSLFAVRCALHCVVYLPAAIHLLLQPTKTMNTLHLSCHSLQRRNRTVIIRPHRLCSLSTHGVCWKQLLRCYLLSNDKKAQARPYLLPSLVRNACLHTFHAPCFDAAKLCSLAVRGFCVSCTEG